MARNILKNVGILIIKANAGLLGLGLVEKYMEEKEKFDANNIYSIYFYPISLKLFRKGIGMYTDYLKKWQKPGNQEIEEELNKNERIAQFLDQYIKKENKDFDLIPINMGGELLMRLKSTLPYLLDKVFKERRRLEEENPPKMAFEAIDKEIKQIKDLQVGGQMKEIPIVENMMGPLAINNKPQRQEKEANELKEDKKAASKIARDNNLVISERIAAWYRAFDKLKLQNNYINIIDKKSARQGDITKKRDIIESSDSFEQDKRRVYTLEESEEEFFDRLRNSFTLPVTISGFRDIQTSDIKESELNNFYKIGDLEKEIFRQSLLAYAWHSYSLCIMGCSRILEKIVNKLFKNEEISFPKPPDPPVDADKKICDICDLNKNFFMGLQPKIDKLFQELGKKKKNNIIEILKPFITLIKRRSQGAKHNNKTEHDITDARLLLSGTLSLLKEI